MSDAKPKKSFFNKPAWLGDKVKSEIKSTDKPSQQKDATQMFARSSGTISDVLAEQKRKEQAREEKKARAAQKEADARSTKRRKTSEEGDYEAEREEKKYVTHVHGISSDRSTKGSIGTQYHLDARPVHRAKPPRNHF
jgi:cell division protein FtsN